MSEFDPFEAMRTMDGPVAPSEEFREALYDTLRARLDEMAVGAARPPEPPAPLPRRGLVVAAALGLVLLMVGALSWLSPADEPDVAIDPLLLSEPETTLTGVDHNPDPGVASPPSRAPSTTMASALPQQSLGGYQFGGWRVLPASEFDGRLGATVVWTGSQLIVWGGEIPGEGSRPSNGWATTNDGGVYDPGAEIWFSLPPAPLSPRTGAAGLWTGTEMLVIGGGETDGAAYDPATRLWRELPPQPIPLNAAAVWTGTEAIFFGGSVAFNPETNSWRTIAEVPDGPEAWIDPRAAWSGDEVIVWDSTVRGYFPAAIRTAAFDVAAYNPNSDSWRRFSPQSFDFELSSTSGVWTGSELLLLGANFERFAREGDLADSPPILGIALDPAADSWRIIDAPSFARELPVDGFGIHSSVWTGDRLIVWAGTFFSPEPVPELWVYDPATDSWDRGASSPEVGGDPQLIWDGATLYAYGGDQAEPLRRLMTLDLGAGESLPSPIASGATIDLPGDIPFEILALEPFVQSAFIGDFAGEGLGRFYDRADTFLQRDAISQVVPLWDGWMTSANGEVWWFPDSISRLPVALQNEPEIGEDIAGFSYFLPTRGDLYSDRIWTVVPGDGFSDPNARSLVRSISVETRRVRTYTEVPPDAFPVNASTRGLLLNSFEWLDTGDGFVEDPGTFKMMLVAPDGNLVPLWAGFGIDLSVDRVVWMDCDEAGVECSIVVSAVEGPSQADLRIEIPGFSLQNGAVASPNGRWLALGMGHQGGPDQAILILDLADGSYETLLTGRNLSSSFAPSVTWSADSEWILSLDGGPLAIRLQDGLQVDLAQYLPESMVVYGVASR